MCGGTPNYKLLENNLLRRGRGVVVATCSSRNFNFFPITQARALKKLRARVALHTSEKSKHRARVRHSIGSGKNWNSDALLSGYRVCTYIYMYIDTARLQRIRTLHTHVCILIEIINRKTQ